MLLNTLACRSVAPYDIPAGAIHDVLSPIAVGRLQGRITVFGIPSEPAQSLVVELMRSRDKKVLEISETDGQGRFKFRDRKAHFCCAQAAWALRFWKS